MEREIKKLNEEWAKQMEEAEIRIKGLTEKCKELKVKYQCLEGEVKGREGLLGKKLSRREQSDQVYVVKVESEEEKKGNYEK